MKRLIAVAAALLALAGCTGVPGSSKPDTIQRLGGSQSPRSVPAPPPGIDPYTLVLDFLDANEVDATNGGAARTYLTRDANNRWQDATVTVIDVAHVSTYDPTAHSVVVTGRLVGRLNASGVYTPDLDGTGSGGEQVTSQFVIKKVNGENRINSLPNGLVLTTAQFQRAFRQRALYFYDASERGLVPEARYVPNEESEQVARWLVRQLVLGPGPNLQNAETNLEFPAQADANRVVLKLGSPTTVEIPGSSQLDAAHRDRLAAQLATTLDQVVSGGTLTITDNHKPISIPAAQGTAFSASGLDMSVQAPTIAQPPLYYVEHGAVYDEHGVRLKGDLGSGSEGLGSIAVAVAPRTRKLLIAGTTGTGSSRRLLIGTAAGGLHATKLVGALSRPSWVNNAGEAWVASGGAVYRVSSTGSVQPVVLLGLPATATIAALRMSPDGTRVAMVVTARGVSQIYVGTVARNGAQVHVEAATPISPVGFVATDVAWNDILKLFAIGTVAGSPQVVEVQVDGSAWTTHGTGNLPQPLDSITVAENQPAWVSAAGSVWAQSGPSWISPTTAGITYGTNPVYLE